MYLVAIAWTYVVVLMTVVEATAENGSVLGAVITFFLYGALPLLIALYLLGTPGRRRARKLAEAAAVESARRTASAGAVDPDRSGHPAGDTLAPVRKEP